MSWSDRFQTPTSHDLTSALEPESAEIVSGLLGKLDEAGLAQPRIEWMGLPWRWTLVCQPADEATAPVYVVCDPENPRVATRVETPVLESLPAKKFQRPVREALAVGRQVGSSLWVEWSLESAACADDMVNLVEIRSSAKSDG
ncbi:MAG: hypothetical protein AAGI17_07990 [Planctomycetota bacterium]